MTKTLFSLITAATAISCFSVVAVTFFPVGASAQSLGACRDLANGKLICSSGKCSPNDPSLLAHQRGRAHLLARCLLRHAASTASQSGSFSSFDLPDSTQVNPSAINPAGTIAGYYFELEHVDPQLRADPRRGGHRIRPAGHGVLSECRHLLGRCGRQPRRRHRRLVLVLDWRC